MTFFPCNTPMSLASFCDEEDLHHYDTRHENMFYHVVHLLHSHLWWNDLFLRWLRHHNSISRGFPLVHTFCIIIIYHVHLPWLGELFMHVSSPSTSPNMHILLFTIQMHETLLECITKQKKYNHKNTYILVIHIVGYLRTMFLPRIGTLPSS